MSRADELGAEHVGEISRHGGEAAAIHRENDAEGEHEQRLVADLGKERRRRIERDAKNEERVIGVLAADVIRQRRQKKRPPILNNESRPAKPAAIAAMTTF